MILKATKCAVSVLPTLTPKHTPKASWKLMWPASTNDTTSTLGGDAAPQTTAKCQIRGTDDGGEVTWPCTVPHLAAVLEDSKAVATVPVAKPANLFTQNLARTCLRDAPKASRRHLPRFDMPNKKSAMPEARRGVREFESRRRTKPTRG